MWNWLCKSVLIAGICSSTAVAFGQATNSGDIRGTVTDSGGALVPGVSVTVLNVDTGVTKKYVTDGAALYDTSSIVNGTYKITFEKEGFKTFVRGPITVLVGTTTVNAKLEVGSTSEEITVTNNVPLLETESGQQETTLTSEQMSQLPQVGQDWQNFTILLPGASGMTAGGQNHNANPGQEVSINGNLPYSNILSDGASTTLPESTNADVSTFETVAELQVTDSNFSAQYSQGGAIFNQIHKSGTGQFHGSVYEFAQNDAFNAKGYGFGNNISVPFLRYNHYGASIGGPVLKKKMFFYFDYDKISNTGSANGYATVPTTAMLSGDFTGLPTIYDPTSQVVAQGPNGPTVTRRSFAQEYGQGNKIPGNLIDPVAKAIAAYYPTASNPTPGGRFVPGTIIDGVSTNNYYYSFKYPNSTTTYFGRLDYDVNSKNRITVSETDRDNPSLSPYIFNCPVNCGGADGSSDSAQVSDVWTFSPSLINEARFGFAQEHYLIFPDSLNQNYPQKLGLKFSRVDEFPNISISGQNCCAAPQSGTHASYIQYVFDPSDVVTLIRGKQVLHFGAESLVYRRDGGAWGDLNGANLSYNGAYTQSTVGDGTTGMAFADFLLGQTQSWSANVSPFYGARMKSPQIFVQDDIKLKPNLTVNLGVRYQIQTGVSEQNGNVSTFDPSVPNPVTGTNGAFWYGETHANGRTKLIAPTYNTFLPRFGASWLPMPNTTVRGGVGLFAYPYRLDENGAGLGNSLAAQGSLTDQTNGITPVVLLSSSGSNLPFGTSNQNPAAYAGQGISYTALHTPFSRILEWSLAVQRELGTNMVAEIAYVGSHGYDLYFPFDLNQVPAGKLGPNDNPSGRPYPYYQGISANLQNGYSNYNSLQAAITKRLTHGVSFNFNYTWSHFLDTQDAGNGGQGNQVYQVADPSVNYGPSQFDVRNAFKGNAIYVLPFGTGQTFLNHSRFLNEFVGGWEVTTTIVLSTGNPFTPTINGPNNSYSQAGAWFPNVLGDPRLASRNTQRWFNPGAFTAPSNGTFGNARRDSVYGPGVEVVNLSAGKTFAFVEKTSLKIQLDAFNAFNHTNFGLPSAGLTCSTPGTPCTGAGVISSTSVSGRTLELGARLAF